MLHALALTAATITAFAAHDRSTRTDETALLAAPLPQAAQPTGVLWEGRAVVGSRTNLYEHVRGDRGPGWYGAHPGAAYDVAFIRVNHAVIAIDPWTPIHEQGLRRLERARQLWLKERGLITKVRTHVNPAYGHGYADHLAETGSARGHGAPSPRATIKVLDEIPRRPSRMKVEAPMVIVKPATAVAQGPPRVISPGGGAIASSK